MNFELFRKNLFLIVTAFVFSLFSTNFFSMDVEQVESSNTPDVIMAEPVASSSTLAEITVDTTELEKKNKALLEKKSRDLTKKIIKILNDSFNQNTLTLLEENKETGKPAVVSKEILSFLKRIKDSISKALEEGDKAFAQTTGYQEDLKIKLFAYLENFSKEYITNTKKSKKKDSENSLKQIAEQIQEFDSLLKVLSKEPAEKVEALQEIVRKELQQNIIELTKTIENLKKGMLSKKTLYGLTMEVKSTNSKLTTQDKIDAQKKITGHAEKENQIKLLSEELNKPQDLRKKTEEDSRLTPEYLQTLSHKLESKKRDYNRELKNFYELGGTSEELKKKQLPTSEYPLEMDEQKRADSMVVNIRGKLYELQAALAAVAHGKEIEAFGQEIRLTFETNSAVAVEIDTHTMGNKDDKRPNHFLSPEYTGNKIMLKQEFDLITDTEIIECKSTSWNIAQYIQNLNRQKFMIENIANATEVHVIEKNKSLQKILKEMAMQKFGNRSIICYVDYAAKPEQGGLKDLFEKGSYFQERQVIEQGFTLWNGENYFHALTIKDLGSFKVDKTFRELFEKHKNLKNFILYIIEPKEFHKITEQRISSSTGQNRKSLSAKSLEKQFIHKHTITPEGTQEKIVNEIKKILNINNTENLPFTIIFIDKENDSFKATELPTSKASDIDSPDFQKLRSKIRDTPPEETPSKKVARRIEGLSMGPKETPEDRQPLPNNQGSPKPLGKVGQIRKNNPSDPLKNPLFNGEDPSTKKPHKSNFDSNNEDEAAR